MYRASGLTIGPDLGYVVMNASEDLREALKKWRQGSRSWPADCGASTEKLTGGDLEYAIDVAMSVHAGLDTMVPRRDLLELLSRALATIDQPAFNRSTLPPASAPPRRPSGVMSSPVGGEEDEVGFSAGLDVEHLGCGP